MRVRLVFILAMVIMACSISAESLWDPETPDLLSGSGDLKVGDSVLVSIDSETLLNYSSSRVDSERLTIELSGGEGGDLFSFLPSGGSSGNQTLRGGESLSLSGQIAVVVAAVDGNGRLVLQGGRTITVQGKQESIILSGTVDPLLVNDDRTIAFSSIANSRLTYSTFLQPGADTVTASDLVREQAVTADTTGTEVVAASASTATEVSTLSLSKEKRQELLLIYLNRIVDLIFE